MGVKVVETAAIFISERCYMAFMPILSSIILFSTIAALLAGGVYLYGSGSRYIFQSFRTLTSPNAFYTVDFNTKLIILYSVFAFGGYWLICWIFYSNTFIVMSAASIWYYQQDSPLCTSVYRLLRYLCHHHSDITLVVLHLPLYFLESCSF